MADMQANAPQERSMKLHTLAPDLQQSGHDPPRHEDSAQVLPDRTSLLNSSRLRGRGSSSVRAAVMSQAQQTHGNRAVQRALNTYRPTEGMEPPRNFRRPDGVKNEVLTNEVLNEVLRPGGGPQDPHLLTETGRPSRDDGAITLQKPYVDREKKHINVDEAMHKPITSQTEGYPGIPGPQLQPGEPRSQLLNFYPDIMTRG